MFLMLGWWQLIRSIPPFSSLHLCKLRKPGFSLFWWNIQITQAPTYMWDASTCPYLVTTIKTRSQYIFLLPWSHCRWSWEMCLFSLKVSWCHWETFFFLLVSSWYFCSITDIHWRRKCFLRHGHGVIVVRGSDQINHNQT